MEIIIGLTIILIILLVLKSVIDYRLEKSKLNRTYIFWSVGIFVLFCLYFVSFS